MDLKVITLHQPWATLIAIGAKKIETRGWSTNHRGDLGIHAAANVPAYAVDTTFDRDAIRDALFEAGYDAFGVMHPSRREIRQALEMLPLGCIIATSQLEKCLPTGVGENYSEWVRELRSQNSQEIEFGNFCRGRYGWFQKDVKRLDTPIPAKGLQRIWDWHDMTPPEVLPHVFDVPLDPISMANPWNALVLMAAGTAFEILDPEAVLTWDLQKLEAAMSWMTYCHYSASDNVVYRKRLIQPEHCKGVIK